MKEHLFQPRGSNLCGQTCVAMLTEMSISDATSLVGKKGLTRAKDLVLALRKKGFLTCGPVIARANNPLPENAILNFHWKGRANGHWVVRWEGKEYDPDAMVCGHGVFSAPGGRVTSYIELEKL